MIDLGTILSGGLTGGGSYRDRRLTVCKLCRYSVYEGEPTVWLTTPPWMGVSHRVCAARAGLA